MNRETLARRGHCSGMDPQEEEKPPREEAASLNGPRSSYTTRSILPSHASSQMIIGGRCFERGSSRDPRSQISLPAQRSTAMKAKTSARGLGTAHQQRRAVLDRIVKAGRTRCVLCGQLIERGQHWDLDHKPDRSGYRGPAHAHCNRRDGALRGNERTRHSRVW